MTRVTFVHTYAVSPWPRVIKSRNRNAHRWMVDWWHLEVEEEEEEEQSRAGVGRMEWKLFVGSKHTAM